MFHGFEIVNFFRPLQVKLISCYFTTSPDGWAAEQVGGRLDKSILRLTHPSLAGAWAELGKMHTIDRIQCINYHANNNVLLI